MKPSTLLIAVITMIITGCANVGAANKVITASGADVSGTVAAKTVTEIDAQQSFIVNYTVGSSVSVKYTVPQSLAQYVDITCSNGKLKCGFKKGINAKLNGRQVKVDVVAPAIHSYDASSSATINVTGALKVNKIDVDASSSAAVNIASVNAASADIEASSSARVNISKLTAQNTDIEVSSSAVASVSGTMGKVDAEATSAAAVTIAGSVDYLDAEASSAGTINASKAKIASGKLEASSAATITVTKATKTPYKTHKDTGASIIVR